MPSSGADRPPRSPRPGSGAAAGPERRAEELRVALAAHARAFRERFGPGAGVRAFFAPGRVNLMGAHLDYNGGPVMPTAIDRGTFLAVRPRADGRLRMASTLDDDGLDLALAELPAERSGRWVDYPLGVVRELVAGAAPERVAGLDVLFGGDLAVGAGLSSSASICVGTAHACDALWGLAREPLELVQAALRAERGFVGVQCGIMDPYAVGLARPGHVLWLDCKDATSRHLPLDPERLGVAVADTGVRRALAQGAFNERVRECATAFEALRRHVPGSTCLRDVPAAVVEAHAGELEPTVARRARHVADEVERTFRARDALLAGDPAGLGAGMTAAHASLRALFEVSVPELDRLVDSAVAVPGVLGARLTGAGFGGCAVALFELGCEDELRARLTRDFCAAFGHEPAVHVFGGDEGPRELAGDWDG